MTAAITGFHKSKRCVMPAKPGRRLLVIAGRRQRLQVGADAERAVAGAGDDGDPQVGIGGVSVECPRELAMARRDASH